MGGRRALAREVPALASAALISPDLVAIGFRAPHALCQRDGALILSLKRYLPVAQACVRRSRYAPTLLLTEFQLGARSPADGRDRRQLDRHPRRQGRDREPARAGLSAAKLNICRTALDSSPHYQHNGDSADRRGEREADTRRAHQEDEHGNYPGDTQSCRESRRTA